MSRLTIVAVCPANSGVCSASGGKRVFGIRDQLLSLWSFAEGAPGGERHVGPRRCVCVVFLALCDSRRNRGQLLVGFRVDVGVQREDQIWCEGGDLLEVEVSAAVDVGRSLSLPVILRPRPAFIHAGPPPFGHADGFNSQGKQWFVIGVSECDDALWCGVDCRRTQCVLDRHGECVVALGR